MINYTICTYNNVSKTPLTFGRISNPVSNSFSNFINTLLRTDMQCVTN